MSYATVQPIWNAVQSRFYKTAQNLAVSDLSLKQGTASIGYMLQHNAEVEYMFAEWFFGRKMPEGLEMQTNAGPIGSDADYTDHERLLKMLSDSNEHLQAAMRELPEEAWHVPVGSPMGAPSSPLEAVGRLLYHTGIHAGQISLILKSAKAKE
ncbi:DinB family protein [Paenibacillus koleovorans]|uniref:DinB family protein n=1 Tax=Paenibacillus koleovorans TaxID=121608 RepID=UPI000FDAB7B8|nr:DinB family protein [Paenibacillus koleovorans]